MPNGSAPGWATATRRRSLRCYSHEFEAVRGGRQIAQEIAQMDAAFAG